VSLGPRFGFTRSRKDPRQKPNVDTRARIQIHLPLCILDPSYRLNGSFSLLGRLPSTMSTTPASAPVMGGKKSKIFGGGAPRSAVEAATLAPNGSPPITRTTFPTCRAHYPGGSSGCACRLLPRSGDLCHEAPTHAVTRTSCSSATGSIDNSPGGIFLH
jgi:hypothetical protein